MTGVRLAILLMLVSGVLFGTAGTAVALGPAEATPIAVGILRIQGGAVALLLVMPYLGTPRSRLPILWRRPAVVITAIGAAAFQPFFFGAVSSAGVALGTLVAVGSEPVFAGLLGWLALRHRPTVGWLAATSIAVLGLVLRSAGQIEGGDVVGLALALAAGFSAATTTVAFKYEMDRGATATELTSASFVLGGLLLIPLLLTQPLRWVATPGGAALVVYLGVMTMAVANVILVRGIHGLPPGPAVTLMLTDPVVATVLGIVVLGETITPVAVLGVVLVLAGIVLQGVVIARASPDELEPAPLL